jgi:His-Xaa-Ser system radical SAM maturase HxsC
MIELSGRVIELRQVAEAPSKGRVFKLFEDEAPAGQRAQAAFLVRGGVPIPEGFGTYVAVDGVAGSSLPDLPGTVVRLPATMGYLGAGDVLRIAARGDRVRTLYRRNSSHNTFLVTERCDNYCVMCSQPPRDVDDGWIIDEILETIPLIDPGTKELGFTGGEPTLLRDRFLEVLSSCKSNLPSTAIHVLSNGRSFADGSFAQKWANVQHPDLMVGIPVYSDISTEHDYVVQADGAFDETLRGILNLKRLNQRVEIRVVLHRHTCFQLPRLAEYIARNLLFVDHVALMGLEHMGFAKANVDNLWIDPSEYQAELKAAVRLLEFAGMRTSIYNHQLCVLDRSLWRFAVKSISDWKNEYHAICDPCAERTRCGGFFASSVSRPSANLHAL